MELNVKGMENLNPTDRAECEQKLTELRMKLASPKLKNNEEIDVILQKEYEVYRAYGVGHHTKRTTDLRRNENRVD